MSKPKARICGPFVPGPPGEADHNGLSACQRCQLVGYPGDAHHTLPDVPEQAAVLARYEPEEGE